MLPDRSALARCPSCNCLFWLRTAATLGEYKYWADNPEWPDAKDYPDPNEADYVRYLGMSHDDSEEETLYVRIRAWWAANDIHRTPGHSGSEQNETLPGRNKNLVALRQMLQAEDAPWARLYLAELAREAGEFYEALVLLDFSFPAALMARARTVRRLAKRGERVVARVVWNEDY